MLKVVLLEGTFVVIIVRLIDLVLSEKLLTSFIQNKAYTAFIERVLFV